MVSPSPRHLTEIQSSDPQPTSPQWTQPGVGGGWLRLKRGIANRMQYFRWKVYKKQVKQNTKTCKTQLKAIKCFLDSSFWVASNTGGFRLLIRLNNYFKYTENSGVLVWLFVAEILAFIFHPVSLSPGAGLTVLGYMPAADVTSNSLWQELLDISIFSKIIMKTINTYQSHLLDKVARCLKANSYVPWHIIEERLHN